MPMPIESLQSHLKLLYTSYERVTGRTLLDTHQHCTSDELFQALDDAPFVLVSHGTEEPPIFNYGNKTALRLFGMSWDEFTSLPSRRSAEQPNREARERLLQAVKSHGFIDNYSGVRIAKNGRRFVIENVTVWNVLDEQGKYHGQAATYGEWKFL